MAPQLNLGCFDNLSLSPSLSLLSLSLVYLPSKFLTLSPIVSSTYYPFLNLSLIPSLFLFSFFLLFFSWSQLQKRLNQARVFYEEASWFDGQFWQKPFFLLKNDRFLSTQQFQPFLQKVFTLLLFFFSTNLVFVLFFLLK